jgi:MarR family transcriptional regulator, organic hydroperoxide resistance regulator
METMSMATMNLETIRWAARLDAVADTGTEVKGNVGYLVWMLATRWRVAMDRTLAPLGLTQAQYSVLAPLYSLSRSGTRPSQRELADVTGLDTVYVSKLVRVLEQSGLLTRATHAKDPRAVQLSLTEQGTAAVQLATAAVNDLREQLTSPLGGNDGERTAELAAMLRELLDRANALGSEG